MEAKDTVMKKVSHQWTTAAMLKKQAEISFKAGEEHGIIIGKKNYLLGRSHGRREVVEWVEVNNRVTPQINENRGANIPKEIWKAKLHEWDI